MKDDCYSQQVILNDVGRRVKNFEQFVPDTMDDHMKLQTRFQKTMESIQV